MNSTPPLPPNPISKKKANGCLALIVILIVFMAVMLYSCLSSDPGPPSETSVYVNSQLIIEDYLKAPATAEYPGSDGYTVIKINDHKYKIAAYVDSENSFGAMIRSKYVVELEYNEDWSMYEPVSVIIDAERYL